jgi:hypothetical protein
LTGSLYRINQYRGKFFNLKFSRDYPFNCLFAAGRHENGGLKARSGASADVNKDEGMGHSNFLILCILQIQISGINGDKLLY